MVLHLLQRLVVLTSSCLATRGWCAAQTVLRSGVTTPRSCGTSSVSEPSGSEPAATVPDVSISTNEYLIMMDDAWDVSITEYWVWLVNTRDVSTNHKVVLLSTLYDWVSVLLETVAVTEMTKKIRSWRCLTCWPIKLWRHKVMSLVNESADWTPNYHKILIVACAFYWSVKRRKWKVLKMTSWTWSTCSLLIL